MITELNLPNYKIRKHSKTPEHMRNVLHKHGAEYLEQKLMLLQTAPVSRVATPAENSRRPTTAGFKKHVYRDKGRERSRQEMTATVHMKDFDLPVDLLVMAQFRKGIIREIEKNNIDLTVEKLNEIRSQSVRQDLLDIEKFRVLGC